jgi:hypothetical protein
MVALQLEAIVVDTLINASSPKEAIVVVVVASQSKCMMLRIIYGSDVFGYLICFFKCDLEEG